MDEQNRKDELLAELRRLTEPLSEKQKAALHWLADHMSMVDAILDAGPIKEAEEKEYMARALEREDYIMVYILGYHRLRRKRKTPEDPADSISQ